MVTLAIRNPTINFKTEVFEDVYDLSLYIVSQLEEFSLKKLHDNEITQELKEGAQECRKRDSSHFINI